MGVRPAGGAGRAVDGEGASHPNAGADPIDCSAAHSHSHAGSHRAGADAHGGPNTDAGAHSGTHAHADTHTRANTHTGPTDADATSSFPGSAPSGEP